MQGDAQTPIASEMLSVGPPASESGKENRGKDKKRYTTEINSSKCKVSYQMFSRDGCCLRAYRTV